MPITKELAVTGLVNGLEMTGSPVVQMDLQNAGATHKNEALVINRGIITSRSPDDLEYFVIGLRKALIGR